MFEIRAPAKTLNNLRPATAPKTKNFTVPAGLNEAESYAKAFISCLKFLIDEIRSTSNWTRRVKLVNGERQDSLSDVYTFVLDDDDMVFEGSRVRVHMKLRKFSGTILKVTNLTPKILYLEIDGSLGDTIDACEIDQDDASLYEALMERYSVETGLKEERFLKRIGSDFAYADRVIENDVKSIDHNVSVTSSDLNADQYDFIQKALGHDISYLWGPPGTGKTKCLGALVTALYDISERSIIASNTNQAVDQVLLKLCRDLKAAGRMDELAQGRIIREGKIHNHELENEFGKYLDINSITKILAATLNQEIDEMTDEVISLTEHLHSLPRLREKIEHADYWQLQIDNLERQKKASLSQLSFTNLQLEALNSESKTLNEEITSIVSRGIIKSIFGKSRKTLEYELAVLTPKLHAAKKNRNRDRLLLIDLEEQLVSNKKTRGKFLELTDGLNLVQLEVKKNTIEKRLNELNSIIKKLRTKLNDLSDMILKEALVVGATLTRMFLVPSKMGKCENLIIDEASTATLPMVHFASSLSKKRVIISGDFRQLPPIINTKNTFIENVLGKSIFLYARRGQAPIADLFEFGIGTPNAQMLEWQYRMPKEICELLSNFAYNGLLKTAPISNTNETAPLNGFGNSITVVDTSDAMPYCDVSASGSRHNTIHALIAERIAKRFIETADSGTLGYCSPYRAQSDLAKIIFNKSGLDQDITAGTVHVFQGDEKDTIIFDTVDGLGAANTAGAQISKDNPSESQLLNVAMSRAKQRIIIIANLRLLDQTLPGLAFLRQILARAQSDNAIITSSEFLSFEKVEISAKASLIAKNKKFSDLLAELKAQEVEINQAQSELNAFQDRSNQEIYLRLQGIQNKKNDLELLDKKIRRTEREVQQNNELVQLKEAELAVKLKSLSDDRIRLKKQISNFAITPFDGNSFMDLFKEELRVAKHSVVIYSGFASVNRVSNLLDIFRETIARGVAIRVIVKYHKKDKWFWTADGISAVQMLKNVGVTVDLRAKIHQKAVLIDNDILFVGSLNPLSFNKDLSDETMLRIVGTFTPLDFAKSVALRGEKSLRSLRDLVRSENPKCMHCRSDTEFNDYRGKKFICIECGRNTPFAVSWRKS